MEVRITPQQLFLLAQRNRTEARTHCEQQPYRSQAAPGIPTLTFPATLAGVYGKRR